MVGVSALVSVELDGGKVSAIVDEKSDGSYRFLRMRGTEDMCAMGVEGAKDELVSAYHRECARLAA